MNNFPSPKQSRSPNDSTPKREKLSKRKLKKHSTSEKTLDSDTFNKDTEDIDMDTTSKSNIKGSRARSPRKRVDSEKDKKNSSESEDSEKEKSHRGRKRENSDKRSNKTRKSKSKRSSQTSDHASKRTNDTTTFKEEIEGNNLGESHDYSNKDVESSIEDIAISTTELDQLKQIRKVVLINHTEVDNEKDIVINRDMEEFEKELREDYEALSRSASRSDISKDRIVRFQRHEDIPYDSDDDGISGWESYKDKISDIPVKEFETMPVQKKIIRKNDHRKSTSEGADIFQDRRIKINVGGRIFETYVSTLRKYPNTLLGTMFHPRNMLLMENTEEMFFDRNPRIFEVILDFFRTSQIHRPPDVSPEMLREEMQFFQIDPPEFSFLSKRVSIELRKLEYKNLILPASEYKKMTRVKLLSEHHDVLVRILDFIRQKVERKAKKGHNSSCITFYSPLHYTNYTPKDIFNVISMNEMRELLVELLRTKDFIIKETNEYSKKKATSIIGLHDQVINYDDPKYFSFHIKW